MGVELSEHLTQLLKSQNGLSSLSIVADNPKIVPYARSYSRNRLSGSVSSPVLRGGGMNLKTNATKPCRWESTSSSSSSSSPQQNARWDIAPSVGVPATRNRWGSSSPHYTSRSAAGNGRGSAVDSSSTSINPSVLRTDSLSIRNQARMQELGLSQKPEKRNNASNMTPRRRSAECRWEDLVKKSTDSHLRIPKRNSMPIGSPSQI